MFTHLYNAVKSRVGYYLACSFSILVYGDRAVEYLRCDHDPGRLRRAYVHEFHRRCRNCNEIVWRRNVLDELVERRTET